MTIKSMTSPAATTNSLSTHRSVNDARAAASRLAGHWPAPSIREYFAPINGETFTQPPSISSQPTALFAGASIPLAEIPDGWMPAYAAWMIQLQRAHDYRRLATLWDQRQPLPPVPDSIVAGRLLGNHSAQVTPDIRRQWFGRATRSPVGAWLAAPAANTREEREAILQALRHDSRLLRDVAQLPAYGPLVLRHAAHHHDLPAALLWSQHGSHREFSLWLQTLLIVARRQAEAAAAALVLCPGASPAEQARWLDLLKQSQPARPALAAVRWAKFTWPAEDWPALKSALQPVCVRDRGPVCCQWFVDIAPEDAPAVLGTGHLPWLWAVELLAARPALEDYAFRFHLGEQLDTHDNALAALVLAWLNQRWQRHHGTH